MKQETIMLFKALGDKTRLAILEQLFFRNLTTADLVECLNLTQPTIYFHMKKLVEAGLVKEWEGKNPVQYSLCYPGLDLTLQQLLAGDPDGKDLAELRREYTIQRYLKECEASDGRWYFHPFESLSQHILHRLLSYMEPTREYTRSELLALLGKYCVYPEDVLQFLDRNGYVNSRISTQFTRFLSTTETLYSKSDHPINLHL